MSRSRPDVPGIARRAALILLATLAPPAARAQDRGPFGIGVAAGSPGGITLRQETRSPVGDGRSPRADALVALVSFDLSGYVLAQGHAVREWQVPDSPVAVYAGPGLVAGVDEGAGIVGVGAVAGLRFFRSRFEIFMQLHPRIEALPSPAWRPGGGVGFRYHP